MKGLSENDIDEKLKNSIIVFKYIEDKDLFLKVRYNTMYHFAFAIGVSPWQLPVPCGQRFKIDHLYYRISTATDLARLCSVLSLIWPSLSEIGTLGFCLHVTKSHITGGNIV